MADFNTQIGSAVCARDIWTMINGSAMFCYSAVVSQQCLLHIIETTGSKLMAIDILSRDL